MSIERDPDGAFLGHVPRRCTEHRAVGAARAWCHDCAEWCYPSIPCHGCRRVVDDLRAGVAWTSVVDNDVARVIAAPDVGALDAATVDAFLLAAHRRETGPDTRAHLFRVRSAYLARRRELADLAAARVAALRTYPPHGGYAAVSYAHGDPWAHIAPEPCL